MILQPFTLNKQKVKRFFAFGCSFTNFIWPTWADIINYDLPQAEFYNFGKSGLGNLAITCRIAEAHTKFNFDENDLIMVLWSTYLREDRYLNNSWLAVGNVYNNKYYDETFTKKYSDNNGYLLRDCALISLTSSFLQSLNSQTILMPSVPLGYSETNIDAKFSNSITNLYKPLFSKMPKSLYEFVNVDNQWPITHSYYYKYMGGLHNDSHPGPKSYFEYISKNVINLEKNTKLYAENCHTKLLNLDNQEKIVNCFLKDTKGSLLF